MELALQALIEKRNEPLDWARNNAQIVHPVRGRISFEPYPYQATFLQDKSPRRIILKARQIGYSQVFAIEALYTAITRSESTILLVSRSQDLAVNLLRYCYQAYIGLKNPPRLTIENAGEMGLENGSRIKSIPANRSTGRGFAATDVYLDEFAYAAYADHIYQSVSPTLSQGGRMTIASTPNGIGNTFYRLWESNNFTRHKIDWTQCPSYYTPDERKSGLSPTESKWYKANRRNYTDTMWASEYDCDFVMSGGAVFRHVRELAIASKQERAVDKNQYVIGVDWGRTEDATVFSVIDLSSHSCIYIDRMTDTDFALQRARLKTLSEAFNGAACLVETNSIGRPQLEELQRMGVNAMGFETTNTTKAQIIDALSLAFEQGTISIVNDETLINELVAYTSERLPSGLVRYSAPSGMHDDTVMALALANWAASQNNWLMI
jgi:phage FluMu gp28-like protein